MEKVKRAITKAAYQIDTASFHLRHRKEAKDILRNIEKVKGKTDPKCIKLSNEYARDVLGWEGYAPWLYVYSAVSERFKEGWMPDNYYGRIVIPYLQGYYGKVSGLKPLVSKLFNDPVFPDLAYYINGLWLSSNSTPINKNELASVLFKSCEKVVFKLDNSLQGNSVFMLDKSTFDVVKIRNLGNGVFQKYIEQHPFFNEFINSSVATLRITTVIDNEGEASVRAAYLRLGRKSDTHVKSSSHIRVPIDLSDGTLHKFGYLNTWLTIDKHPDTHTRFENRRIPQFKKCLEIALELHIATPYVRCVGWDMVVDVEGKVNVMEWNGYHNDIKFSEATQGPNFSDLGWEKLWRENYSDRVKIDLNWRY